jgi:hypothetical protein
LYAPDVRKGLETFAGAWLAPLKRFFAVMPFIRSIVYPEQACLAIIRNGGEPPLMTRDYFDFMVTHLSPTTNYFDRGEQQIPVLKLLRTRVKQTARTLQITNSSKYRKYNVDDRLRKHTVAVIPFVMKVGSILPNETGTFRVTSTDQKEIRISFFEATFWSIYRYVDRIAVSVCRQQEIDILQALHLPYWQLINVTDRLDENVGNKHKRSTHMLPREALIEVYNRIEASKNTSKSTPTHLRAWNDVKYLYFTEGDQILNVRASEKMMDFLDSEKGSSMALSPHRMQVQYQRASIFRMTCSFLLHHVSL